MASVFNPQENGLVKQWNKMLKFGIQAFSSLDRPWEGGIAELLSQHHHMPSSPQGPSPRGCGSPQPSVSAIAASAEVAPVELLGQTWNKLHPLFRPGEQVLVKAGPVPKGTSPYWGPCTVEKVLGRYTFVLSDGQCWSA